MNLEDLSNQELLSGLRALAGEGHRVLARLLAYLGEVEQRRLDLESACSSLFDFCVRRLGMSEDEACRRVRAARIVRKCPIALSMIERGEIHLTALLLLRDHLTEDGYEELLRAAAHKTKSEVEHLIAQRFPRPDAPVVVEPLPPLPLTPRSPHAAVSGGPPAKSDLRAPRIEPLSPERYRVQFTASAELRRKIERRGSCRPGPWAAQPASSNSRSFLPCAGLGRVLAAGRSHYRCSAHPARPDGRAASILSPGRAPIVPMQPRGGEDQQGCMSSGRSSW